MEQGVNKRFRQNVIRRKREDTEERAMYMNEERHLQADVKVGFPGNDCVVVHHAQT